MQSPSFLASAPAVLKWARKFAQKTYDKPNPGSAIVMELDEMWHFIKMNEIMGGSDDIGCPVSCEASMSELTSLLC